MIAAPFPSLRFDSAPRLALAAMLLLSVVGCYYPPGQRSVYGTETQPAYAPEPIIPTALVIVVEGECTEPEFRARRGEIINYLIERGYINQEDDLISDPANATRIIRAIVSNGGFSLSVFNQSPDVGPQPDLEVTDILYPADPYFIFGFAYLYEIGPRRLPPRPPGYHPHPRPPHSHLPPGYHGYDHGQHWSRPGQPNGGKDRVTPPSDRPRRDENQPRRDPGDHVKRPDSDREPNEKNPRSPAGRVNPPPGDNLPPNHESPRPNVATPPTASAPDRAPDRQNRPHPGNGRNSPPAGNGPRTSERPQPEQNAQAQPPATPPPNSPPPLSPAPNRTLRSTPPEPRPAPPPPVESKGDERVGRHADNPPPAPSTGGPQRNPDRPRSEQGERSRPAPTPSRDPDRQPPREIERRPQGNASIAPPRAEPARAAPAPEKRANPEDKDHDRPERN